MGKTVIVSVVVVAGLLALGWVVLTLFNAIAAL